MAIQTKTPRERERTGWVKADRIAALFDVSVGAVYHGEAGMHEIKSAYLPSKNGSKAKRPAKRYWWPSALELRDRMLEEATARKEAERIPSNILRLLSRRGRRRRASGSQK